MGRRGRTQLWIAAAMLMIAFLAQALTALRNKSATWDETIHITGGYAAWRFNDYRLHPENGILPQRVAGLPLLFMDLKFPDMNSRDWTTGSGWKISQRFFYMEGNDADAMLFASRVAMSLFTIGTGLVLFLWGRILVGEAGALLALFLFAFSPTVLANGALATSDMAATFCFLICAWAAWEFLHAPRIGRAALLGIALGLLCTAKFSAVVQVFILPAMLAGVLWRRKLMARREGRPLKLLPFLGARLAGLAFAVLVAAVVIWGFFGFRHGAANPECPGGFRPFVYDWNSGPVSGAIFDAAERMRLLPQAVFDGFEKVMCFSAQRSCFLNGEFGLQGWWYFFPLAFLMKTPIPFLALLVAGAAAFWGVRGRGFAHPEAAAKGWWRHGGYGWTPLVVLALVYGIVALLSHINLGIRHLLPIHPFLFLVAGMSLHLLLVSRKLAGALLAICIPWTVFEAVAIWPHHLAYFNQWVGGPSQGYRHLVDSSLDWGQDLKGLARWLKERPQTGLPVYLSYNGNADRIYYGLEGFWMPSYGSEVLSYESVPWRLMPKLVPGTYCISATLLQGVLTYWDGPWTAEREARYQLMKARLGAMQAPEAPLLPPVPTTGKEAQERHEYDNLRFSRLCMYLRSREPDAQIGYSINIYELCQREIDFAMEGVFRPSHHNATQRRK